MEVLNDLYPSESTTASFGKLAILPLGLEHSPGRKKLKSENFKKVRFV